MESAPGSEPPDAGRARHGRSDAVGRIVVGVADFPNLGDHLALLPVYHGLRLRYPGARILLASRFAQAALAQDHGFVDELLLYQRADLALWRAVRRYAPDVAICLRRRSLRARVVFGRLSGAAVTVGIEGLGAWLLHSERVPHLAGVYRPYRYLEALKPLGAAAGLAETVQALARGGGFKAPQTRYAVLVPAGTLPEKQWGPARFAAAAAALAREDPALAWYAVLGAREQAQGFAAALATVPGITLLIDRPLSELAGLFLAARLVLANDCGPGNLAQMAGVPCVLVFGNWDGAVIERIGWWFDPRPGALCLTTRTPAPITAIGVEAVLGAARELLERPGGGGEVRYLER